MLFDTDANKWSVLAEDVWFAFNEWSPDGKFVYARSFRGDAAEIVRVKIRDRELEHLFSLKEKDIHQSSADIVTWWIGLTPDDGLLLMRDRSVQEIYALDLLFH